MEILDAPGAGFDSFAGCQADPLQVRVFTLFLGKIVMSAEELPLSAHDRTLAADGTDAHSIFRV